MRQYVGLIHKEDASDYGVSFPDFPGVVAAGASLAEARELAEQALAFHVEGLIDDGEALPVPTSVAQIEADRPSRYHNHHGSIEDSLKVTAKRAAFPVWQPWRSTAGKP
ncbi:type II toxin-antitoxin system HicB family antitoxin [Mesorhizobium humile]|uniref:type II toxin-antitoxin system HicB family antitoxin n=1 Tax=Mesorhizobium humile TaxID=3072313 RepID=UPI003D3193F4